MIQEKIRLLTSQEAEEYLARKKAIYIKWTHKELDRHMRMSLRLKQLLELTLQATQESIDVKSKSVAGD